MPANLVKIYFVFPLIEAFHELYAMQDHFS